MQHQSWAVLHIANLVVAAGRKENFRLIDVKSVLVLGRIVTCSVGFGYWILGRIFQLSDLDSVV